MKIIKCMNLLIINYMKYTFCILILFVTSLGLSQNISKIYEKNNEAVVLIKAKRTKILYEHGLKTMTEFKGYGSGFVVSEMGDIITVSHLVQTAEEIVVTFADGEEIEAEVLYSYPLADVALIRLIRPKSNSLTVLEIGDSDKARIGDKVFIIGAPYGIERSLSVGYISGKYKRKDSINNLITTEFIQSDAAINQGSSGAPMLNVEGEVIGVASFIITQSQGFQGIGFATTSNIAKKMLLEKKAIWTGLKVSFISGPLSEIFNVPQQGGILIEEVALNSLGDYMGLQGGRYKTTIEDEEFILGGDIILTIEKIPLINEDNLIKAWNLLQDLESGDYLSIVILRKGEVLEISKMLLLIFN